MAKLCVSWRAARSHPSCFQQALPFVTKPYFGLEAELFCVKNASLIFRTDGFALLAMTPF